MRMHRRFVVMLFALTPTTTPHSYPGIRLSKMATNTTDSDDSSSSSSSSSVVGWGYGYLIIETVHHFWDPEKGCYESRTSLSQEWPEYPDTAVDPQLVEWERLRAQGGS
jgi:hypothetical protein